MRTVGVDAFWVPVPELVPPLPWAEEPGYERDHGRREDRAAAAVQQVDLDGVQELAHGVTFATAGAAGELPLAGVEVGVAAPFGEDAVPPPVRLCPPPSTYAVAVIVPVRLLEVFVDPDAGTGASLVLWIVSSRPLT